MKNLQLLNIDEKIKEIYTVIKCRQAINQDSRFDLLGGLSGEILFKIYFHKYYKSEYEDLFEDIESLIDKLSNTEYTNGGISGLAGVLYVLNTIKEIYPEFNDIDELIEQIDQLVLDAFNQLLLIKNYDALHGATGIIIVYLYNPDKYKVQIEEYINSVYDVFTDKTNLVKFSKFNDETLKYEFKSGYSNSSLSHGISGMLVTLSKVYKLNWHRQKVEGVCENLLSLLNSFKLINEDSCFTNILPNTNKTTRLAWCVGDIGIALAYWHIGSNLMNESYKLEAIQLLKKCATRSDLKNNLVYDAGFCHGTSGIAHIFNKFYFFTKDNTFSNISQYWLNQTIDKSIYKDGLAGFKAWQADLGWQNESGLLEGISGIGLVLLSFLTDETNELCWDRCFLVS
jgi:lantibiotic modifying enzyme